MWGDRLEVLAPGLEVVPRVWSWIILFMIWWTEIWHDSIWDNSTCNVGVIVILYYIQCVLMINFDGLHRTFVYFVFQKLNLNPNNLLSNLWNVMRLQVHKRVTSNNGKPTLEASGANGVLRLETMEADGLEGLGPFTWDFDFSQGSPALVLSAERDLKVRGGWEIGVFFSIGAGCSWLKGITGSFVCLHAWIYRLTWFWCFVTVGIVHPAFLKNLAKCL